MPEGMSIEFRCWKCAEIVVVVPGEYFMLSAYVPCPACGEPNAFSYAFPQGSYESG